MVHGIFDEPGTTGVNITIVEQFMPKAIDRYVVEYHSAELIQYKIFDRNNLSATEHFYEEVRRNQVRLSRTNTLFTRKPLRLFEPQR